MAGFGRTHLIVLASAISVANAAALHTNMRRYITGTDGDWFNLDRWREWWWPHAATPMTVWAIGSVSFAVVCTWLLLTLGAGPAGAPTCRAWQSTSGRRRDESWWPVAVSGTCRALTGHYPVERNWRSSSTGWLSTSKPRDRATGICAGSSVT